MGLHVSSQVGPVSEGFAAVGAAVRFVPGVGAHVALQQPGPGERFAANIALVAEAVGQHMHG